MVSRTPPGAPQRLGRRSGDAHHGERRSSDCCPSASTRSTGGPSSGQASVPIHGWRRRLPSHRKEAGDKVLLGLKLRELAEEVDRRLRALLPFGALQAEHGRDQIDVLAALRGLVFEVGLVSVEVVALFVDDALLVL